MGVYYKLVNLTKKQQYEPANGAVKYDYRIALGSKKYPGLFALVDGLDFEDLSGFNWSPKWSRTTESYYAQRTVRRNGKGTTRLMHRQILGLTDPRVQVDHKNHDTLDNRRDNLRVTDNRGNQANLDGKASGKYSSVHTGVSWDRVNSKWRATTGVGKLRKQLGRFSTQSQALKALSAFKERQ